MPHPLARCVATLLVGVPLAVSSSLVASPALAADGLIPLGPPDSTPVQVGPAATDPDGDVPEPIVVRFATTTTAHDLTVTASGEGLRVDEAHPATSTLSQGEVGYAEVSVVATTPGLHALTVTVSSSDAGSLDLGVTHVWSAGGPFLGPPSSGYAGRTYLWQGYAPGPCPSCRTLEQHRIYVVDDHRMLLGDLSDTAVRCRGRCTPYAADHANGVIQIGTSVIAQNAGMGLFTDGLVTPDLRFESFASATLKRYVSLPPDLRPRGTFTFDDESSPDNRQPGLSSVRLVLGGHGRYDLTYEVRGPQGGHVRQQGTAVVRPGRLVLHPRHGHGFDVPVQVLADNAGDPVRPRQLVVRLPRPGDHTGSTSYDGVALTTRR